MGSQYNNSFCHYKYQQTVGICHFTVQVWTNALRVCGYLQSSKNENENVILSIWSLEMVMEVLVYIIIDMKTKRIVILGLHCSL